jgi:ubiquinone/menaquinone biosynthesis C-methylase UbiE
MAKKGFDSYYQTVLGTPRAKHTFFKRLKTIEAMVGGFKGKSVLDVGCGYGFNAIHLAAKCNEIFGLDLDPERISSARDYSIRNRLSNVSFFSGDAENLPFEEKAFDIVMGNEFLHHVANPQRVINEMCRVTRKGGAVVISDHNRASLLSELIRKTAFRSGRCVTFTKGEVEKLFEDANLNGVQMRYIIFTLPFRGAPSWLIEINSVFERFIEMLPILNTQCGVFVIKGEKI